MDFFFRIGILVFGYVYPAFKCFKALDSKPKIEQLQTWCQYWIIIGIFTGFERVADTFVSWLPFYNGGKLAFIIYLWHPDTKGTEHIFTTYVKPLISEHAQDVDTNWVHLRERLMPAFYQLLYYMQVKIAEITRQSTVRVPQHPQVAMVHSKPSYLQVLPGQRQHSGYQSLVSAPRQQLRSGQFSDHQHSQAQRAVKAQVASLVGQAVTSTPLAAQHVVLPEDKEEAEFEFIEIPSGVANFAKASKNEVLSVAARSSKRSSSDTSGSWFWNRKQHQ